MTTIFQITYLVGFFNIFMQHVLYYQCIVGFSFSLSIIQSWFIEICDYGTYNQCIFYLRPECHFQLILMQEDNTMKVYHTKNPGSC